MRAVAVVRSDGTLRVVDHPEPPLERDGEVLIRMLEVGVCGTDREIARGDFGTPPGGEPYLVIGHESLGVVIDIGDGVTRTAPGDLVVATVRRPCPHATCRACPHGRQDFCSTGDYRERGIQACHGFMTELVVEAERYLHVVPAALRPVAVLIEPLTIAEKALIQVRDVQRRLPLAAPANRRALVLGAGPVGLLGALALLERGFDTYVYSREPADGPRSAWVGSVGARYLSAVDVDQDSLVAHAGVFDVIYEAAGSTQLALAALQALARNGVCVLTGVPGRQGPIEIDAERLVRGMVLRNQILLGTVNAGPDAFAAAVADIARFHARWPEELGALVTGRHPPEAAAALLLGEPTGIKDIITFAKGQQP